MRCFSRAWWCCGVLVWTACAAQEPALVASNCSDAEGGCSQQALHLDSVDVLLVIDDSASIAPLAEGLKQQLPRMISALTTGSDGDSSFPPAKSVHVAVTTTDMGGGDDSFPSCIGEGQDAVFVRPGEVGVTCDVSYPGYLSYEGGPAALSVAESAACVPLVFSTPDHASGCGFEQPLEAALKSLWPSDDTRVEFVNGHGHGTDYNRGFLRDDSLLVVIVVTDEDDCSAQDLDLFKQFPDHDNRPAVNLLCHFGGDKLYGVQRYVDHLKHVRPNNDNVIFSVVAGVPEELVTPTFRAQFDLGKPTDAQRYYDAVLAHPLMQEEVMDAGDGTGHLQPSCSRLEGDTHYVATPPRRLVQAARGFGVNGVLGSLCTREFGTTMGQLIRTMGERLSGQSGR